MVSLARGANGALHEIGCVAGTTGVDPLCDRLSTFDHPVQYFTLAPDGRFAYALTDGTGLGAWGMRVGADGVLRDAGCTWVATPFLTPCGPGAGQALGPISISPGRVRHVHRPPGGRPPSVATGRRSAGSSQDDAGGLSAATDTAVYYYRQVGAARVPTRAGAGPDLHRAAIDAARAGRRAEDLVRRPATMTRCSS